MAAAAAVRGRFAAMSAAAAVRGRSPAFGFFLFFFFFFLLAAAVCALAAAPPEMPVFPPSMSYRLHLFVKAENGSFHGLHHISRTQNKARIDWAFSWNGGPLTNILIVMDGANAKQYAVGPGTATCVVADWPEPVFNQSWNAGARYEGIDWFPFGEEARLCHKWSNTSPYFIQPQLYVSDFYADFFTLLPVGFDCPQQYMEYSAVDTSEPSKILFDMGAMNCQNEEVPSLWQDDLVKYLRTSTTDRSS